MTNKKISKIFALYFASSISIFAPGSEQPPLQNAAAPAAVAAAAQPEQDHKELIKRYLLNAMEDAKKFRSFVIEWSEFYFSISQKTVLSDDDNQKFVDLCISSCAFLSEILENFQKNYSHLMEIDAQNNNASGLCLLHLILEVLSKEMVDPDKFNFYQLLKRFHNAFDDSCRQITNSSETRSFLPDESIPSISLEDSCSRVKKFARNSIINFLNVVLNISSININGFVFLGAFSRDAQSLHQCFLGFLCNTKIKDILDPLASNQFSGISDEQILEVYDFFVSIIIR